MSVVKRMLVGTALGSTALIVRDHLELLRYAWSRPEAVGTIANDHVATILLAGLCQPNKVFADVGSHIGSVISRVRRADPSIEVIAFEPTPEKAAWLRKKFPKIEVHECAVGDASGMTSFYVNTRLSGYSSLSKEQGGSHSGIVEIVVPMRTLDDVLSGKSVDIIKLDIEGAELRALRGAQQILTTARPVVMFESVPGASTESDAERLAMWGFLENQRYDVLIPNRVAHEGAALDSRGFLESHVYPQRTTNFFAVPQERRDEVRARARRVLGIHG